MVDFAVPPLAWNEFYLEIYGDTLFLVNFSGIVPTYRNTKLHGHTAALLYILQELTQKRSKISIWLKYGCWKFPEMLKISYICKSTVFEKILACASSCMTLYCSREKASSGKFENQHDLNTSAGIFLSMKINFMWKFTVFDK